MSPSLRMRFSAAAILLVALLAWPVSGAPPAMPAPFPVGERLVYTVKWDPPWYLFFLPSMTAGEMVLELRRGEPFLGQEALEVRLDARSSGTLARLAGMEVEDSFRFYSEPEQLCALGSRSRTREGKRMRSLELDYLRDSGRLRFRETDEAVDPPEVKKDEIKEGIPACVHDPFSALYAFRASPLSSASSRTFMIGHNDRIKEVRVQARKLESIETPAGRFKAWKVDTEAMMGGLFKDGGEFNVWLTEDGARIPVQFEARVPLGKVRGKLDGRTFPEEPRNGDSGEARRSRP